jgi:hypothetical protein
MAPEGNVKREGILLSFLIQERLLTFFFFIFFCRGIPLARLLEVMSKGRGILLSFLIQKRLLMFFYFIIFRDRLFFFF